MISVATSSIHFPLTDSPAPKLLSIVVPCYNEEDSVAHLRERVSTVVGALQQPYELVFVNDGSTDNTLAILLELRTVDPHVTVVNLTRNFGKEIALTAGLTHAVGDAIVVIDCDLQDPPELIGQFIAH